ncbi:PTS sugar transporter subunit IIB [Vibrio sp. MACH09]|uniref:PTS sugar transporter subunit IIB n=1 Tax=Vibrio sp. MACH09 TaxID=3025122 RepID=UPI0027948238|nr:PTS sugar transporter subunit IIB [Vibrio sp. MACH09]GLO63153.1 PTS sugar transporter subunit IIB [Vibrio sp. MACH09]
MKIFLCCSAGMSTSMLVNKMRVAAQQKELSCEINAYSVSEFEKRLQQNDVCLIAPQVKYQFKQFKQRATEEGKACGLIDMLDYGMMKGDVILEQAVELYQSLETKGSNL